MNRQEALGEIQRLNKIHAELADRKLEHFSTYLDSDIKNEWFHKYVYSVLDDWIEKKKKKVAIFMPPQHGKSKMSSVITPAKILGKYPKSGVAVASYAETHASKFNRECQDLIDSERFKELYPNVKLPGKDVETGNELRNNKYFEVVKYKGFFKAVSIGGALTGTPVDYGIIDDPIKDRKQANSSTYRDNIWNWYNDVFKTRLHNDSCQLMLFTRWHEDDIAGRLFNPKSEYYDEEEANEWTVIVLPALKENSKAIQNQVEINDPREIGGALWPSKHSKEKHEKTKKLSPQTHSSLNQQRPSPAGGGKIKQEHFTVINESELPFNPNGIKKDFWIDGAFTENVKNDESAQMVCSFYNGNLYIFNCHGVRKELSKYLEYIRPFMKESGYTARSSVFIEMKASGYSFYSMLRSPQFGSFNCRKINSRNVSDGKHTRVESIEPTLASGKVFLIRGNWNKAFVDQCCAFPNDVHDDMVDVLAYAIHEYYINNSEVYVDYSD